MGTRTWGVAAITFAIVASGATGCVIRTSSVDRYRNCDPNSDTCFGTSSCQRALVMAGATQSGFVCTDTCTPGSTCPSDVTGLAGICVVVAGSSTGQCFRNCDAANGCPAGQMCAATMPGSPTFCIPNGGGTCGAVGQACCGGSMCAAGSTCNGGTCVAGPPACGGSGQPCCATPAMACNGSLGLVCNPNNNTCALGPYSGCDAASAASNAACVPGQTGGGQTVATTCQLPLAQSMNTTGWCTARCSGSMTECPAILGTNYNCYVLMGSDVGQCFSDCNAGMTCAPGTTCRTVMARGVTGPVQVCMP